MSGVVWRHRRECGGLSRKLVAVRDRSRHDHEGQPAAKKNAGGRGNSARFKPRGRTLPRQCRLTKGTPLDLVTDVLALVPFLLSAIPLLTRLSSELLRWSLVGIVLFGSARRAARALRALSALSRR